MYEVKQAVQQDIDLWLDSTNPSEYQDEHCNFTTYLPEHEQAQDLGRRFAKHHIVYHPETYYQPHCHLIPQEHHQQVMFAFVKLGFFDITLQLLYQDRENKERKEDMSGSFGSISELELFDQTIVIKTIEIKDTERRIMVISSAIKEYCCLKIASALGFAPKTDNYLGFDIIIFENCVQFAMEKTPHIDNFTEEFAQQLQQSLQVFHRIHLIHFDIKPSNIAFSQHYNRAVFLDFGLSQMVREEKGLKTLIKFRGSLAFCSEEMLRIFYDYEHKHFIDVYENDVVCLDNAIQIINMIKIKRQKMIRLENQTICSQRYRKIVHSQFYLIDLAKYLLCNMKYKQFKILLNSHLRAYLPNIFAFLQEINSNPHLDAFFAQEMSEFQHNDAYILLQAKFKSKNRLWSSKANNFDGNESTAFARETVQLSLDINQQKFDYSQSQIVRILQSPNIFPSSKMEIYFTLYLKATRFDSNIASIPLQTKIKYAHAFYHHILKSESPSINTNSLYIFCQNIQFLMRYTLSTPLTRWKHQNIYFVLLQFVILDCNFQPFFEQFKTKIATYYSNTSQEIMHLIQLTKISKLLLLKHKSQHPLSHKIIIEYLDTLYFQTLGKIISCQSNIGLQMREFMKRIIEKDQQKYDYLEMVRLYQQDLWRIDNHILRESLKKYIIAAELYQRIANGNINCCFSYLKHMNPYFSSNIFLTNKHTLTFDLGLYEYIIIMKAINNTSELRHVAALFKNVFGFEQIYHNFKFQMIIDLSRSKIDHFKLLLYARQIIHSPLPILHESISAQFFIIWKKINQTSLLYKKQSSLIELALEKINIIFEKPKITDISFQNAVNQSHILNQSVKFQKNKEQYIQNILACVKQYQMSNQSESLKALIRMKYFIYAGYLYLSIDQYQKSYESFKELLLTAFSLQNIKFCYINLFMTARILNRTTQQTQFLRSYYYICHKMRQFRGYFAHKDMDLIYVTLETLDQNGKPQQIYDLLSDLSLFITLYPLEDYFNHWICSITRFQQKHSHYFLSQSISLHFSNKMSWENVYLIFYFARSLGDCTAQDKLKFLYIISKQLKAIKQFARELILKTYYGQMFGFVSQNYRKSISLIQKESKHCDITSLGRSIRKKKRSLFMNQKMIDQRHIRNLRKKCKKVFIL